MPRIFSFLIAVFLAVSVAQAGEQQIAPATGDPLPSAVVNGASLDRHLDDLLRAAVPVCFEDKTPGFTLRPSEALKVLSLFDDTSSEAKAVPTLNCEKQSAPKDNYIVQAQGECPAGYPVECNDFCCPSGSSCRMPDCCVPASHGDECPAGSCAWCSVTTPKCVGWPGTNYTCCPRDAVTCNIGRDVWCCASDQMCGNQTGLCR